MSSSWPSAPGGRSRPRRSRACWRRSLPTALSPQAPPDEIAGRSAASRWRTSSSTYLRPVIDEIVAAHGPNVSTHVIASELTRRRARTRTGSKQWSAMQALRLLRRLGERTTEAP